MAQVHGSRDDRSSAALEAFVRDADADELQLPVPRTDAWLATLDLASVSVSHDEVLAALDAPIERHPVHRLVTGAWARRHQLRLADALYVELAGARGSALVTTDPRLRAVPMVDVVVPPPIG